MLNWEDDNLAKQTSPAPTGAGGAAPEPDRKSVV